ncbi:hypothetical protein ACIOML_06375 [Streptomyces anulatus]
MGAETTLLRYSDDRAVFEESTPTLRVTGGDTVCLGAARGATSPPLTRGWWAAPLRGIERD